MIGTDQDGLIRAGPILHIVAENERRAAPDQSAGFQSIQVDVERDLTERHDHFQVGQQFQFALEVGAAVAQFLGGFVVGGRNERRQ